MTEINNKIQNYTFTPANEIGKAGKKVAEEIKEPKAVEEETNIVPDTGVLGRSQVTSKAGDITKSVDEAVYMAKNHPEIITAGDDLFEDLNKYFVANGMSEADAYFASTVAMEEFADIAKSV